jgi:hypothetical protein
MVPMAFRSRKRWWVLICLAGLVLRLAFLYFPRSSDDDTAVYAELGRNLVHTGTYGMYVNGRLLPSLFRLPGYPLFLALFGGRITLVLLAQTVLDLVSCLLMAMFVHTYVSRKASTPTLLISVTCLFTAAAAATPMTESLSVFAVSLAIYSFGRFLSDNWFAPNSVFAYIPTLALLAAAASLAMLLRPDGILLTISIALTLLWHGAKRRQWKSGVKTAAVFLCLSAVPLVPWTVRNAVTFHVFEPLAPRHTNDPGERVNLGFYHWMRTWSVDYLDTGNVFWHVGEEPIAYDDLPARAITSEKEAARTRQLLNAYNVSNSVDDGLDYQFELLAREHVASHRFQYYVVVPVLRVLDMWFRPRTAEMNIDAIWWDWSSHPMTSLVAIVLILLNVVYIGCTVYAVAVRRFPLITFFAIYIVLRCFLLATIENPESRYTIEAFPMLLICTGVVWSSAASYRNRTALPVT